MKKIYVGSKICVLFGSEQSEIKNPIFGISTFVNWEWLDNTNEYCVGPNFYKMLSAAEFDHVCTL